MVDCNGVTYDPADLRGYHQRGAFSVGRQSFFSGGTLKLGFGYVEVF